MVVIEGIMDALTSNEIYNVIGHGKCEGDVKTYMHQTFLSELKEIHGKLDPTASREVLAKRAKKSLLWEGDANTTVNNMLFMGVQHRPDFIVQIEGMRIAVEVKRGDTGAAVREALGQCLVYASQFDFSCCVLVDTSNDKKIRRGLTNETEQNMMDRLWNDFNIRFIAV